MVWRDPAVLELCRRHGEHDPEALIVRLCRELVAACPTEHGPSPLAVLGSIRLVRGCESGRVPPGTNCSGLLVPQDGGYRVIVNADEPEERRHYSFGHEIVHTFFREVRPGVTPSAEEELLCEIGAAELTMPAARFIPVLAKHALSFALFEALQQEFGVSFEASARRALSLTDESACFFVAALARTRAQEHQDRGEAILRLVSWAPSRTWPDDQNYKNLPVATDSLIAHTFANLDERSGRGVLGIPFNSTEYELDTRGYAYPRGAVIDHRQVVVLAKV